MYDPRYYQEYQAARKRQRASAPTGNKISHHYPLDVVGLGTKAGQIVINSTMWARADMSKYDLRFCQFVDCDMNHVNMSGSNLANAHFLRCDLRFANFTDCTGLSWDSFEGCLWAEGAQLPNNMRWEDQPPKQGVENAD